MNAGLTFMEPWWLLLLPVALAIALWAERRTRVVLSPRRARVVRTGRLLIVVLLVAALADLTAWRTEDRLTVVFAVDVSRSVGPEGRERVSRFLAEAAAEIPPGDRAALIAVGDRAMVEDHPTEQWQPGEILSRPGDDATDLEAAVRLAEGLFPPGHESRLVVLTDGIETRGSVEDALARSSANLDVVWVPLAVSDEPEVLVERVAAPDRVLEGEPHRVRVQVRASRETEATLRIFRGSSLVSASRVRLDPDRANVFSVEQAAPLTSGSLLYTAEVQADDDRVVENNRATALVRVEGRPHVLMVDSEPSSLRALVGVLERAGMRVTVGGPGVLPGDLLGLAAYDAIVLSDAPASRLSEGQMVALRGYVEATGGGLLMLGGPNSFGPGGYWRTPIEEVLPVDMDVQDRRYLPTVGLMLCIDKSGSMGGRAGAAKIDVAKAAAVEVADGLTEMDRIGVIAFDAAAKWVVPVTSGGDRDRVRDWLGTLRAGGGTDAYPAMEMAWNALKDLDVRVKHMILLTDGQLAGRDHEGLAGRMSFDGITISTVAIGTDADSFTLERIANAAAGHFHVARDVDRLPRILLREAFRISRSWLVEEPFRPTLESPHPALWEFDPAAGPPLEGYVASTGKPLAEHPLVTDRGEPLLSVWRFGLGKSVAFTSDAKGRWASSWMRWNGFAPFWRQLVRWAARGEEGGGRLTVVAQPANGRLEVAADLITAEGSFVNGADLETTVLGPGGERLEAALEQVGPGRYEAHFDASAPGPYVTAVMRRDAGGDPLGSTATAIVPFSSEFRSLARRPEGLERLVATERARIAETSEGIFRHRHTGGVVRWSLASTLLAAAAMLLVGEVAARRLRFDASFLRRRVRAKTAASERLGRLLDARGRARTRAPSASPAPGVAEERPPGTIAAPPVETEVAEPPAPEGAEGSTTSRLLRAKRKARR